MLLKYWTQNAILYVYHYVSHLRHLPQCVEHQAYHTTVMYWASYIPHQQGPRGKLTSGAGNKNRKSKKRKKENTGRNVYEKFGLISRACPKERVKTF